MQDVARLRDRRAVFAFQRQPIAPIVAIALGEQFGLRERDIGGQIGKLGRLSHALLRNDALGRGFQLEGGGE